MYVLAWTPIFWNVPFTIEKIEDHNAMLDRIKEIWSAKYEDLNWQLYTSVGGNDIDVDAIEIYHNGNTFIELAIPTEWYGGKVETVSRDKILANILMKYVDRLSDPVEYSSDATYSDPLEDIVDELLADVREVI